jgi:LDH2 family malate/lactate/ureidoglycolate dehydrogenase
MGTDAIENYVAEIFTKLGVDVESAHITAEAIVAADVEGIPSHGVMLVPMYVDRLIAGSVSTKSEPTVVHDGGSALVLDAANALGQLTSDWAVPMVIERALAHGLAAVAVRNGFHFGTAGFWARQIAEAGLVGVVMCNTRPLMPAPGGAERVVGNNPLAIALPSTDDSTFVVDMATSATAMGKIRLADSAGKPIPEGWAADENGLPTTDAAAAIRGMLLPAAGPKGFGLAAAIELLCGGLSGGAIGDEVAPLYGDPARPYRCSHLFLAIDPERFGIRNLGARVDGFAKRIRSSKRAPGAERIYAPGDLERARSAENAGDCPVPPEVLAKLKECAAKVGVEREIS